MTIERLEELHTLTGEMCKEMIDAKRWTVTAPDYAFDIRSLISSEIERQYNNPDQLPCYWCDRDILVQEQTFNLAGREINRTLDYHYCPMCGRELRTPLSLPEGKMR